MVGVGLYSAAILLTAYVVVLALPMAVKLRTWTTNRGVRAKKTGFRDIDHLE